MGIMGTCYTKEMLVYVAFAVDALNTFVTFPLFVTKGPEWALDAILSEEDKRALTSSSTNNTLKDEVERRSFQQLWELFMICYEGYVGFTASTLICIYQYPATLPIFSYSLFALYLNKFRVLWNGFHRKKDALAKSKLDSIMYFFLPCYGGYCCLHLYEQFARFRSSTKH